MVPTSAPQAVDAAPDGRRSARTLPSIWVDIDNPPQVQYLAPIAAAFTERGSRVLVTARDYGITLELLRDRGISFTAIGRHFGAARHAKVSGNLRRAGRLLGLARAQGRPSAIISNSRSSVLAARMLRVPSFVLCDYEYVNMAAFKASHSYVLHPSVIDSERFVTRGIDPSRVIPFAGLKEDITFDGIDLSDIEPSAVPGLGPTAHRKILVRPAAEESHYHRQESAETSEVLLRRIAAREDVLVVFSPRYEWQTEALERIAFANEPLVLRQGLPFLELLAAVDAVVSGGGTMTREAAYLGLPAVSTFRGELGEVDAYLESAGRLTMIRDRAEAEALDVVGLERRDPLRLNPHACTDIVDLVTAVVRRGSGA